MRVPGRIGGDSVSARPGPPGRPLPRRKGWKKELAAFQGEVRAIERVSIQLPAPEPAHQAKLGRKFLCAFETFPVFRR